MTQAMKGRSILVRDVCRTLAVLEDERLITSIESLLDHADTGVHSDAIDALFLLKDKPPKATAVTKSI